MAGDAMCSQCQCLRKPDEPAADNDDVCFVIHIAPMPQQMGGLKGGF
jgi:hypothetical protein